MSICECLLCPDENAKGTVKVDIKCGVPFEPTNVYKMLQAIDFEAFKVRSLLPCMLTHCRCASIYCCHIFHRLFERNVTQCNI